MEKENIHIDWEVISKSFRGELSGEERERLESWLAVSSRHRDFYRRALEGGETDAMVGMDRDVLAAKKDELMRRARVMTGNVKPRWSLRFVWYAAAVILPVAIAVGMWVNMGGREKNMVIAQRVQPGSGRAVLELHDGRTYFLDTTRVVETGIEGNLAKAEKQSLVYTKREAEELVYNKVIVPRAGEYSLTLSDGTRIWLNSDSEIRYPVAFGKERRTVFLSGEAYFEVEKDAERPFYVVLDGMEVKVYGTSFNVNTHYQGKILTTLVEGKVGIRVKSTGAESILQPNQMAEFNCEKEEVEVTDVDTYYYTAWRAGEFVFQNETIEEIMDRLCRWYDTEVFYANDDVRGKRFTGIIAHFTDVADVLHLIGETATVQFDLKGDVITVSDLK